MNKDLVIVDKKVLKEFIKNIIKVSYSQGHNGNHIANDNLIESINFLPLVGLEEE